MADYSTFDINNNQHFVAAVGRFYTWRSKFDIALEKATNDGKSLLESSDKKYLETIRDNLSALKEFFEKDGSGRSVDVLKEINSRLEKLNTELT